MKRICTICVRSGSSRLENKNIYPVLGVPLLAYSIAAAHENGLIEQVVVTSDSAEYLRVAQEWGADRTVLRPASLATSRVSKTASIAHAVADTEKELGFCFDTIVDLDVTAPLRRRGEVGRALRMFDDSRATALISAVESKSTPYSNLFFQDEDGCLETIIPSDLISEHTGSARTCYALNASIYVWQRDAFMANPVTFFPRTKLYIMPQFSRYDVDTLEDLEYVEYILRTGAHDLVSPR